VDVSTHGKNLLERVREAYPPSVAKADFDMRYANIRSNPSQKAFVDRIMKDIDEEMAERAARLASVARGAMDVDGDSPPPPAPKPVRCHRLQARGGCGKSYVLACIASYARSIGAIVVISAFTGLVASSHNGGYTMHR